MEGLRLPAALQHVVAKVWARLATWGQAPMDQGPMPWLALEDRLPIAPAGYITQWWLSQSMLADWRARLPALVAPTPQTIPLLLCDGDGLLAPYAQGLRSPRLLGVYVAPRSMEQWLALWQVVRTWPMPWRICLGPCQALAPMLHRLVFPKDFGRHQWLLWGAMGRGAHGGQRMDKKAQSQWKNGWPRRCQGGGANVASGSFCPWRPADGPPSALDDDLQQVGQDWLALPPWWLGPCSRRVVWHFDRHQDLVYQDLT